METLLIRPSERSAMHDFALHWTQAQPTVAAFIWSLVPNGHDADDLLQRTAESLVEKFEEYDDSRSFVSWAMGVAKIEVLRFRQERRRDRLVFDDETIDVVEAAVNRSEYELAEMRTALKACAEQLTGRLKQVLQLHYAQEASPEDIAKRLGLSENAVFVSLHRARMAMRNCMERKWHETGGGR